MQQELWDSWRGCSLAGASNGSHLNSVCWRLLFHFHCVLVWALFHIINFIKLERFFTGLHSTDEGLVIFVLYKIHKPFFSPKLTPQELQD